MTDTIAYVPPMWATVEGQEFGGWYWDAADFTLAVTADVEGCAVRLELTDEFGTPRVVVMLTAGQARALFETLGEPPTETPLGDLAVLRRPVVTLGNGEAEPYVSSLPVAELREWLDYALGLTDWDGGDNWEY